MAFLDRLLKGKGHDLDELARRLGISRDQLAAVTVSYREFSLPKRAGGRRRILAPEPELKRVQRRILRRVLALLVSHPAAVGFERGQSIVTNARHHVGKAVVVRLDARRFFESTSAKRVHRFFRKIGWNRPASNRLTELCTSRESLPQGAPTSPRLSNLVNYRLDHRLNRLAKKLGATYTRYADDLTFSFRAERDRNVKRLIHVARMIARDEGYELHTGRKLRIRRRHQQQRVTGLIVNERINLPRQTRRWLRAVNHHLAHRRGTTLSETQIRSWQALAEMVARG